MWHWNLLSSSPSPTSGISPHDIPPQLPTPKQNPLCEVLLLCPCVLIVQHPPMSENMWCLVFCSSVNLLRMMVSRFIHVLAKKKNSSFFMAAYYSMVYMCHIFFIHSSLMGIWVDLSLWYCKQCHNECMCAYVFIIEWFIILWVYTQKWDCWDKCYFYF